MLSRALQWFLLALYVTLATVQPVYATTVVFDTAGNIIGSFAGDNAANYVGRSIEGMNLSKPFVSATGSGITATAKAAEVVTVGGIASKIPFKASVNVATAAVAARAASCLTVIGAITCAATALALAQYARSKMGYADCPSGVSDSFGLGCKPTTTQTWHSVYGNYASPDSACRALYAPLDPTAGENFDHLDIVNNGATANCWGIDPRGYGPYQNGYAYLVSTSPGALAPPALSDSQKNIENAMGSDPAFEQNIYQGMKDAQGTTPRDQLPAGTDLTPPSTPLTVDAPPVVIPTTDLGTKQVTNPDGTTSTERTKQDTTVTPVPPSNPTLGNINQTTYTVNNVTTTTTTNNSTGAVTTSTQTTNNNQAPDAKPPEDKSPRECGTPGKPKCQIDETGTQVWKDTSSAEIAKVDAATSDAITKVGAGMKKDTDTAWPFTFQLPSSCGSWPLFLNIVVEFCRFQPVVHDLMTAVWVASTTFVVIGMFGRTIRGS